jgi:xanthine dehydrogenase YagS FAD-binding subunit
MRSFTFERARSPAEAAATAALIQGAKFIAGGTNLLDLMKLQIEAPTHLIDVNGLALDKIEVTPDGGLRIGALVRNTDLAADERIRRDYALLSRALLAGASGQLRNMATTAGNLASVHYSDTDIRDLGHSKNDGRCSYAAIGSSSLLRGRRPSTS